MEKKNKNKTKQNKKKKTKTKNPDCHNSGKGPVCKQLPGGGGWLEHVEDSGRGREGREEEGSGED
jgi:hypothetical protein